MLRRLIKEAVLGGAVLATAAACAGRQSASEHVSDAWISAQVETRLAADPQTNAVDIDVDTEDGVVALRGVVSDDGQRREAAELASTVKGVERVENHLQLGHVTVGERLSDSTITAEVKSKLIADSSVDAAAIDVDTNEGRVTLSGYVTSEDEKREVEQLARSVDGVEDVANQLEIDRVD